jgi:hypothetical protein
MEKIGKYNLKDILVMTLRHIKQTNDFIGELIPIIESMEEPVPVIVRTMGEYPEILSLDKASEFTGYSKSYLYKLIHEGELNRHGQGKFFQKDRTAKIYATEKKVRELRIVGYSGRNS